MVGWRNNRVAAQRRLIFPRLDPGHEAKDFLLNFTEFGAAWRDLTSVGFSIARADNGGDMYGGLIIDDLRYTVETRCK
jgi:hypothetical protein